MRPIRFPQFAILLLTLSVTYCAVAVSHARDFIILQSTTSTQNSGLFADILPLFEDTYDIDVRVVAVGTGQAIKNATNGDGDVLLVHAKDAEEAFVEAGYGLERFDVMYNDFVLVGPRKDPARVFGINDITNTLSAIAETQSVFVSRGDDSGTHKAELKLWQLAKVRAQESSGRWYRETGSGMGATLNVAVAMDAYTLTDRATWIAFGNKARHRILVEGDPRLFNQYGITLVNPSRHPNVNQKGGQQFIDWILSDAGQQAIGNYQIDQQSLFFPNAKQ